MQKKRIFPIILGVWLVLSACPALAGMPGTEKWVKDFYSQYQCTPAIDAYGNILVRRFRDQESLYAVKPDGTKAGSIRWRSAKRSSPPRRWGPAAPSFSDAATG